MALTRTLAQLRQALKIRAGLNTSGTSVDLTTEVLNELLNDAIYEAWDVIVSKWADYYTAAATVSVVADADTYALPSDFYKLRVVWIQDGDRWLRMLPADLDAAHLYTGQTVGHHGSYRYRTTNRNLVIMPVPSSTETVKLFYTPIKQEMTLDADSITFDVPIELKFVLAIAWRDVLDRQNLDPSPAIAKMQAYEAKLRTAADNRDAGEPFYLDARGPYGRDYDDEAW